MIKIRAWDTFFKIMSYHVELTGVPTGSDPAHVSIGYAQENKFPIINMLWSGLLDDNEKKIYAGDICWYHHPNKKAMKCEIQYLYGAFVVKDLTTGCLDDNIHDFSSSALFGYADGFEIIGNIYENPELLCKF